MERVTVSSKGQIEIPKAIRRALQLSAGTRLFLDVRGEEIVLSKEPAWKKLHGAAGDRDLMGAFAAFKEREREGESKSKS